MPNRQHRDILRAANKSGIPGRVRIIGGCWRGRWLPVPAGVDVRPSPDRVRETLFNWLEPFISGARCLDLFAGTGVLGFEALSRGAKSVTLIERHTALVRQLEANAATLNTQDIDIVHADAIEWLEAAPVPFDIVFVDPPFERGYVPQSARLLERGWIGRGGLVYVERERDVGTAGIPRDWHALGEGATRHVSYALYRREPG